MNTRTGMNFGYLMLLAAIFLFLGMLEWADNRDHERAQQGWSLKPGQPYVLLEGRQ